MHFTWYVSFEAPRRGLQPKRPQARFTKKFATEAEAKEFARVKGAEGLAVLAGTINPHLPKKLITANEMASWLDD